MYAEGWPLPVEVCLFPFYICCGGDRLSEEIRRLHPRRKPWLLEWCGINLMSITVRCCL